MNLKIGNKFKDIDIKNCTYYFCDDMINIKNLDLNKIKIWKFIHKIFLFITLDMWRYLKIKDQRKDLRSKTDNSDDYGEKYIKIKFNLDDDLPLNEILELRNMIIAIRSFLHEGIKYYPQVFLKECSYKL